LSSRALTLDIVVERLPERGPAFRLEVAFRADCGITVVCGPSGAGKSSLLLALLGAIRPISGRIALGESVLFDSASDVDLAIRRRRVGMVFQDAPLFPHLRVSGNVAFGAVGDERRDRARTLLEQVGATRLAERRPSELSGGQRQRVALARALAAEPAALLLDEPFSSIDAAGRESLGALLVSLQSAARIPFIHVTHDLPEALRLGTRLILLDDGSIAQSGTPADVIARPSSMRAARAVGTENLLSGVVRSQRADLGCTEVEIDGVSVQTGLFDCAPGTAVTLGVRAEEILLALQPIRGTSARNVLPGRIESFADRDHGVEVLVVTPAPFRVMVTPVSVRELGLETGQTVYLLIKATAFQRLT